MRENPDADQNSSISYDLIIVGAGPAGLASALEAKRLGLQYIVLEKGAIVHSILGFPTHSTFFSTAERLSIGGFPLTSPNARPSRVEVIEYYLGVARAAALNISLYTEVRDIRRCKDGGFTLSTPRGSYSSTTLILATGYFDHVNTLAVPGEELPKVSHYYHEPFAYFGQNAAVIGGRNSAAEAALDLYRHGAKVTLIHRKSELGAGVKYWIRPDIVNRIAEGSVAGYFNSVVTAIGRESLTFRNLSTNEETTIANDAVFALTGYRPDVQLLDSAGIRYDQESLVPELDSSTLESNIPGIFLVGSIGCGCKTWEIFIENGREQAVAAVKEIALRILPQPTSHIR